MLIRWATVEDKSTWLALSREYDKYIIELTNSMDKWYDSFDEYMENKINKRNAIIAVDKISGRCNGLIAFSMTNNRITFFAVSESAEFTETAERLLTAALRQLDTGKDITVQLPVGICDFFQAAITAFEKHGFVITGDDEMDGVKAYNLERAAAYEKRDGSFSYD